MITKFRRYFVLLAAFGLAAAGAGPTPPSQPVSGPGGADYSHKQVTRQKFGEGDTEYWLFEPADPVADSAPVIVFLHGWSGVNPMVYGGWIKHLVRRGNIVIFPRYQATLATPPRDFAPNTIAAVKAALSMLANQKGMHDMMGRFAVVGHSAGGNTAANFAALAAKNGLPVPKAVFCVAPGKSWTLSKIIAVPLVDLSTIPAQTLLLTAAGDRDHLAQDVDAKQIYEGATQVPKANKNFVLFASDDHGKPPLLANHYAPLSPDSEFDSGERRSGAQTQHTMLNRENSDLPRFDESEVHSMMTNALDYYGYWKLFDALCDAAFYNKNREFALGNTPEQRFMGKWSDGTPVKELVVER